MAKVMRCTSLPCDRVWISTYNLPRKFDNGVYWLRLSVRLMGWHRLGGVWWSRHWPFVKVLLPQGPREPIIRPKEAM